MLFWTYVSDIQPNAFLLSLFLGVSEHIRATTEAVAFAEQSRCAGICRGTRKSYGTISNVKSNNYGIHINPIAIGTFCRLLCS